MKRTVLIVDDNEMNREILKNTLRRDYEGLEAANGREALDLMTQHCETLSAVLLDVVMPVMDGYETMEHIRDDARLASIPIIIVTGSTDETSRTKALTLGASDFLLKPYNPEIILHCLRNNIALRETASIVNTMRIDKLTGLYNQDAFYELAEERIQAHEPGHFVLSGLNIDNFKVINDQHGRNTGDLVLQYVADCLKESMMLVDGICCRLAEDKYAMLYPARFKDTGVFDAVHKKASRPDCIDQIITIRIGRYLVTDLTLPVSSMCDRACLAWASIMGKYDVYVAEFNESMLRQMIDEQQIVNDMAEALRLGQFEPWFQPQYNHADGALIGAEALARWRRNGQIIPPGKFIPVFEKNGFIYQLDKSIWEQTCVCLRRWLDSGVRVLPVSVNISRQDIFRPDIFDYLVGLAEKYRIPLELLRLEVTESAFAESTDVIISVVKRLIDYGFTVEIDDFGSGYSSLNTLKDVPAQILKLDMKFMETSDRSQRGGSILQSIVRMARWLNMSVIAEGVETKEQADFLKSIGCFNIQGYFYSRPVPLEAYETLLFGGEKKEPHLAAMETVEHFNEGSFWNTESIDSIVFNGFIGGACVFEAVNGLTEILRVNDNYIEELGIQCGQNELMSAFDPFFYIDPPDKQRLNDCIQKTVSSGKSQEIELRLHDGGEHFPSPQYVRFSMCVISKMGERFLYYVIVKNVTNQRLAEQKQRELSGHLQSIMTHVQSDICSETGILENLPVGAALLTFEGELLRVVHLNRQYWELVGREPAERDEPDIREAVHPDDLEALIQELHYAVGERRNAQCDVRIRCGEGEYHSFHVVGKPVAHNGGHYIYAVFSALGDASESQNMLTMALSAIMMASTDMSFVKDRNLRYIAASPMLALSAGCADVKDMIGKTDSDLLGNKFGDKLLKEDMRVLENGETIVNEGDVIPGRTSIDGAIHYVTTSKYPLKDQMGRVIGLYGISRDITAQREQESKLKLLMDGIPGGLVSFEINDGYFCAHYFSEGFYRSSGYTPEEYEVLTKDEPLAMIKEDDRARMITTIKKQITSGRVGEPLQWECRCRVSSGEYRWYLIKGKLSGTEAHSYVLNAMLLDIDNKKKLERQLSERRKEFSALIAMTPGGIFRYSVDSDVFSFISQGMYTSIGYTPREFKEKFHNRFSEMIWREDRDAALQKIESDIAAGAMDSVCEYRIETKSGGLKWVLDKGHLIAGTDGKRWRVVMVVDISERKEMEAMLDEENQHLQTLAGTDPLTGIMNRAAFAQKVNKILCTAKNITQYAFLILDIDSFKLVNDTFGHSVGDQTLIEAAVSLCSVLRHGDLVGRLGGDEFVIFLEDIPGDEIVIRKARQICGLIHKFFSTEVEISASIGIAVSPRDGRTFEELYKKADSALYHAKGTGKNSFAFYQDGMTGEHSETLIDRDGTDATGQPAEMRQMLVVDDSNLEHILMSTIFMKEFILHKAYDGGTALSLLRHFGTGISVVLLDLMMPGMDGFAVLKKMRENAEFEHVPVIVVSGSADQATCIRAIRAGATDFVAKPIDPEVLRMRVFSAIERADSERLRAKNSVLKYQNSEIKKYKLLLEQHGIEAPQ